MGNTHSVIAFLSLSRTVGNESAVSLTKPNVSISSALLLLRRALSETKNGNWLSRYRIWKPKANECNNEWLLTSWFRSSGIRVWVLMSVHWLTIHTTEWFSEWESAQLAQCIRRIDAKCVHSCLADVLVFTSLRAPSDSRFYTIVFDAFMLHST